MQKKHPPRRTSWVWADFSWLQSALSSLSLFISPTNDHRYKQHLQHSETKCRRRTREDSAPDLNSGIRPTFLCSAHVPAVGKPVVGKEEVKGLCWASWSGVLGPEVSGIRPKYSNLTEINAADANHAAAVLVTGDDLGLVKLYRFPCLRKGGSPSSSLWLFSAFLSVALLNLNHLFSPRCQIQEVYRSLSPCDQCPLVTWPAVGSDHRWSWPRPFSVEVPPRVGHERRSGDQRTGYVAVPPSAVDE